MMMMMMAMMMMRLMIAKRGIMIVVIMPACTKSHIWDFVCMGFWVHPGKIPIIISLSIINQCPAC